jgi:hypothetical protein
LTTNDADFATILQATIHDPPANEIADGDRLDELDRIEGDLLACLRWRKDHPEVTDHAGLTVGQLEEQLIAIHGRKSVLRSQRRLRQRHV